MTAADLPMGNSFLGAYQDETIAAAITVLVAFGLARLVDRTLRRHRAVEVVAGRPLSPQADTRLRLLRRLAFTLIIVVGIALAAGQFPAVRQVATGLLASSALLGLVAGFAARQTLANAIAGIMLAITQPIRIGDLVTFEEETGEVEDVRLTYTYLRCDDGRRLIVPNEQLAQKAIGNHTVIDPRVQVEVSLWIALDQDASAALEALATVEGADARVAEVDKEGIRLALTAWTDTPGDRGRRAAQLRADGLSRLRGASLSSGEAG